MGHLPYCLNELNLELLIATSCLRLYDQDGNKTFSTHCRFQISNFNNSNIFKTYNELSERNSFFYLLKFFNDIPQHESQPINISNLKKFLNFKTKKKII